MQALSYKMCYYMMRCRTLVRKSQRPRCNNSQYRAIQTKHRHLLWSKRSYNSSCKAFLLYNFVFECVKEKFCVCRPAHFKQGEMNVTCSGFYLSKCTLQKTVYFFLFNIFYNTFYTDQTIFLSPNPKPTPYRKHVCIVTLSDKHHLLFLIYISFPSWGPQAGPHNVKNVRLYYPCGDIWSPHCSINKYTHTHTHTHKCHHFGHNLLTLKLFQTCMSFFLLLNTKDIMKNIGNQIVAGPHSLS